MPPSLPPTYAKIGFMFSNLHSHSEKSLLDGVSSVESMLNYAKELGQEAFALTDHGNLFGWTELEKAAKKIGIKPIYGCELYMAPWGEGEDSRLVRKPCSYYEHEEGEEKDGKEITKGAYTHLTVLSKNYEGALSLIKISSLSYTEGYYRKPRADFDLIRQYNQDKNLICLTGCPSSELNTRIANGDMEKARAYLSEAIEVFGKENVFVEVMAHNFKEGNEIERRNLSGLKLLSEEFKLPLVATNDCHYAREGEKYKHEVCLCLNTKSRMTEKPQSEGGTRFAFSGSGFWVRSAEETKVALIADGLGEKDAQKAVDNTEKVVKLVEEYELPRVKDTSLFPTVEIDHPNHGQYLYEMATKGLEELQKKPLSEEQLERLKYEILDVITPKGFADYFLFVKELIDWAKGRNIYVGPGRGSVGGSLTAYALGLTMLDPIKYDLSFERFLNPERESPPDIDIDVERARREEVIEHLVEKFGEENVARICTFTVSKGRTALLDAARCLALPVQCGVDAANTQPQAAQSSEAIPIKVEDVTPIVQDWKGKIKDKDSLIEKLPETALALEGVTRQTGMHPCGVIVSSQPITDYAPVQVIRGNKLTQWEYKEMESRGFIKVDILGLKSMYVLKLIAQARPDAPTYRDICSSGLNDEKTFRLLRNPDFLAGVFQVEGGIGPLMKSMQVATFEEISLAIALFRPGPLGMGTPMAYIRRKFGKEENDNVVERWNKWRETHPDKIEDYLVQENPDPKDIPPYQHYFIHEELAEVVQRVCAETLGLTVFQESVQRLVMELAGFSAGQADMFRRAIGKKDKAVLQAQFEPLKKGMEERGYSDEAIQAFWQVIVPFSSYGFNKSHSYGYAMLTYTTAYLKAHYPAEFYAAYLTVFSDNPDKIKRALNEIQSSNNISIKTVSIFDSKAFAKAKDNQIYLGFESIRGVSATTAQKVENATSSLEPDMSLARVIAEIENNGLKLNKVIWEGLVKAGAFDSLGYLRRNLLEKTESLLEYLKVWRKEKGEFTYDFGQPEHKKDYFLDILDWENESLGRSISGNKLDNVYLYCLSRQYYRVNKWGEKTKWTPFEHYADVPTKHEVSFCGIVDLNSQKRESKAGRKYAYTKVILPDGDRVKIMAMEESYKLITQLKVGDFVEVVGQKSEETVFVSQAHISKMNRDGLAYEEYFLPLEKSRALWRISDRTTTPGKVINLYNIDFEKFKAEVMKITLAKDKTKKKIRELILENSEMVEVPYMRGFARNLTEAGYGGIENFVDFSMKNLGWAKEEPEPEDLPKF